MTNDVAVRVAVGVSELIWSGRAAVADPRADRAVVIGGTVLGVRNLGQAALMARHPGKTARRLSVTVDLLHAGSMLVAGSLRPSLRRPCWTSAGMATALAATSWLASRGHA